MICCASYRIISPTYIHFLYLHRHNIIDTKHRTLEIRKISAVATKLSEPNNILLYMSAPNSLYSLGERERDIKRNGSNKRAACASFLHMNKMIWCGVAMHSILCTVLLAAYRPWSIGTHKRERRSSQQQQYYTLASCHRNAHGGKNKTKPKEKISHTQISSLLLAVTVDALIFLFFVVVEQKMVKHLRDAKCTTTVHAEWIHCSTHIGHVDFHAVVNDSRAGAYSVLVYMSD